MGPNAKKRHGVIGGPNNGGYDDADGSYIHVPRDHLAYRYEVLKIIGKGSFGQVARVYDHKLRRRGPEDESAPMKTLPSPSGRGDPDFGAS